MTSNERQKKIIRLLDKRRKDTMEHLSIEFHVSTDTISRDIATLNEDYTSHSAARNARITGSLQMKLFGLSMPAAAMRWCCSRPIARWQR